MSMSGDGLTASETVGRPVSYAALHRFTAMAFERAGLSDADAKTGADVLATTDA
jgi:LDH2 family malate/lactate/ureidoglycolate dehydrogenase